MAKPACHTVGILVGVGMEVTLERGLVGDIMLGGADVARWGGDVARGGGGATPTRQGEPSVRPPHMEKNKLLLNEYLDEMILCILRPYFLWKWDRLKCGNVHTFLDAIASLEVGYECK